MRDSAGDHAEPDRGRPSWYAGGLAPSWSTIGRCAAQPAGRSRAGDRSLLARLRICRIVDSWARHRHPNWVGTVGLGVIAGTVAHYDAPALAVMTAALPPNDFSLFDCIATTRSSSTATPARRSACSCRIPRNPRAPKLVAEIARASGAYLIGG